MFLFFLFSSVVRNGASTGHTFHVNTYAYTLENKKNQTSIYETRKHKIQFWITTLHFLKSILERTLLTFCDDFLNVMRRRFIHPSWHLLAGSHFSLFFSTICCHLMLFATKKAIVIICCAHNLTLTHSLLSFFHMHFCMLFIKSSLNKCGANFSKSWLPFRFVL